MEKKNKRGSGVLLHISSLPSNYGIGTMGEEAYKFVDFLKDSSQKYWQILPIGQTSYGDSPYQAFSIYAGNPYFIDLDILVKEGLLVKEEITSINWGENEEEIDYAKIYNGRYPLLKIAYKRFEENKDYKAFIKAQKSWLDDYSMYMCIKKSFDNKSWNEWDSNFRKRDKKTLEHFKRENREEVDFWKFIQFKFYEQWNNLKTYANENGISIVGDIPIYVAYDSVDVWANPACFDLDKNLKMKAVAGCPPDAFSATGQLWGNPLYDWEYLKKNKYSWWIERVAAARELYDIVRIDHFRGFAGYYAIGAEETTAINGEWRVGPGAKLFARIEEVLGKTNIIAEDLGFLTEDVVEMLETTGYPGMKLLQFAFDSRDAGDYLPHNYTKNSVTYIGTHDNDTAKGWVETGDRDDIAFMKKYLDIRTDDANQIVWELIRHAMATVSNLCIIQMQDYLCLDNSARMNTPSKLGGNWAWRMKKDTYLDGISRYMKDITKLYQR